MQSENHAETKLLQLVLEFLNRFWGLPHNLAAIDESMTEDYLIKSVGKVIKGREDSTGIAFWKICDGKLAECGG